MTRENDSYRQQLDDTYEKEICGYQNNETPNLLGEQTSALIKRNVWCFDDYNINNSGLTGEEVDYASFLSCLCFYCHLSPGERIFFVIVNIFINNWLPILFGYCKR